MRQRRSVFDPAYARTLTGTVGGLNPGLATSSLPRVDCEPPKSSHFPSRPGLIRIEDAASYRPGPGFSAMDDLQNTVDPGSVGASLATFVANEFEGCARAFVATLALLWLTRPVFRGPTAMLIPSNPPSPLKYAPGPGVSAAVVLPIRSRDWLVENPA